MKKTYEKPTVETVKFQYRDQVVVASGRCEAQWKNIGTTSCESGTPEPVKPVN